MLSTLPALSIVAPVLPDLITLAAFLITAALPASDLMIIAVLPDPLTVLALQIPPEPLITLGPLITPGKAPTTAARGRNTPRGCSPGQLPE